jgi:hypothetical protein
MSENTPQFSNAIYNPTLLLLVISIIVVYYVVFASLGAESLGANDQYRKYFEYTVWVLFIVLLLLDGMAYIFNIDIIEHLKQLFSLRASVTTDVETTQVTPNETDTLATININVDTPQENEEPQTSWGGTQVYHIPDNTFDYTNARAVCNAYGARLATFKEVDEAYQAGADWCGYGWSEGQMALYPTQYAKWNELQKNKDHKNDCGRPGINGGYIGNPNIKFGINCFGKKPNIKPSDALAMQNKALFQRNAKEKRFDERVAYWRTKLPEILIDPFNHDNWSAI